MSCCKDKKTSTNNGAFVVLILYILLAIVLGSVIF